MKAGAVPILMTSLLCRGDWPQKELGFAKSVMNDASSLATALMSFLKYGG